MHLHGIEINNFRGIKHLKFDKCGRINLFVGKNNSSKTSILESIFLLLGISNPELINRIHLFRDLILNKHDDLSFIFHNLDYKNNLEISGSLGKNAFRNLKIVPNSTVNKTKSNKVSSISDESLKYDTSYSQELINELQFKFAIKEFQKPQKNYKATLTMDDGRTIYQAANNYSERLRGVYISPKVGMTANLDNELEKIIINKAQNEIVEVLNNIDSNIVGISLGTKKMIYLDINGVKRLVPINLAGDGVRRLLSIILGIYNAKDGVLLIDEIENGFHFSVLESLWKAINVASKKFNVQIFTTTHNIEALKSLTFIAKKSNSDFQDSISSYTIRKNNDGELQSFRYDYDKLNFSIEQNIEIR